MDKDSEKKVQELQLIEQNLSNLLMQKQTFQARLLENENALKELNETKKQSYRIIGNILVAMDKERLKKDLESEKEIFDLRIKNIEKQEDKLKEHAQRLQAEVLKNLK
ncbi:MAG: Prefoldin subunit beta [archaeon GW2011_AR20]|nr:MAG: Prefoldin subunit beta [archaeon GW2011_AR20]MBS3160673.1 prefoldin subunit [Candidatus Woesearchaeota archaeon]